LVNVKQADIADIAAIAAIADHGVQVLLCAPV